MIVLVAALICFNCKNNQYSGVLTHKPLKNCQVLASPGAAPVPGSLSGIRTS